MTVGHAFRANPGGEIASSEVFGRDRLIQQLWRILERQSLVLCAERRMGKTCVVKKMVKEAPEQYLTVYRDLEGVRSPIEFVETIFQDVEQELSGFKRLAEGTRQLIKQLGGTEIAGMIKLPEIAAPHWKSLLMKTLEDLVKQQES
ncbi:MAG: ATP-binding protein, partial [Nostocaceae cyanobacterium]|nr:ATP-binding protein [Nostocaceae cyanobacterium]